MARTLEKHLGNVMVFHLDDFIHPKNVRYDETVSEWEAYYYKQWRYDYLIQRLLQPVKKGLSINDNIELYDKEQDDYIRKQIFIPTGTQILIEGVFLQRAELRKFFDFVIYLDIDKETRRKRVLKRDSYIGTQEDILTKYEQRYFPAEERYVKEYDPIRLANQVITESTMNSWNRLFRD
ncbi:uridine kinase [Sporosarcina sp. ACRSL]|nr:uridine kinase [Sporosarcina sp. ACRSL]